MQRVLVISGSMGTGKTTMLGEASDLLAARGIVHAAVDLDAVNTVGLAEDDARSLAFRNLASLCETFRQAGIEALLLAEAVESREAREAIRRATGAAHLAVCRLTATPDVMEARIRLREPGMLQETFVARARALDAVLRQAAVEDFRVSNEGRPITEAATEVLAKAGWLDGGAGTPAPPGSRR